MTLLLCPSAEGDPEEPEPFLELEEETEEAPASSESASPKGAFRIKEEGYERVTREGQPYQRQQAQA